MSPQRGRRKHPPPATVYLFGTGTPRLFERRDLELAATRAELLESFRRSRSGELAAHEVGIVYCTAGNDRRTSRFRRGCGTDQVLALNQVRVGGATARHCDGLSRLGAGGQQRFGTNLASQGNGGTGYEE
jgi:hypothetical protein